MTFRLLRKLRLQQRRMANEVVRLYDVGVAGMHRLMSHSSDIMEARVIIAIAGMEERLQVL